MIGDDDERVEGGLPLSRYSTAVLGYPASRSDRLSIPEIATNLLTQLDGQSVFKKYGELVFVAHSLGGIVVKQMILNAANAGSPPLAERTAAIFLVATPSHGAPLANIAKALPGATCGRLVADLTTIDNNSYLQQLQRHWHDYLRARRAGTPTIYCAYETQPFGGVVAVPQQNMDGFCAENSFAANEDHVSIVKPTSKDAPIFQWLRRGLTVLQLQAAESNVRQQDDVRPTTGPEKGLGTQPKRPSSEPPPELANRTPSAPCGSQTGDGNVCVGGSVGGSISVDVKR